MGLLGVASLNALYVGETEEALGYLGASHHKWEKAISMGMNEIHVLRAQNAFGRRKIETALRHALKPPLNEQRSKTLAEILYDRG